MHTDDPFTMLREAIADDTMGAIPDLWLDTRLSRNGYREDVREELFGRLRRLPTPSRTRLADACSNRYATLVQPWERNALLLLAAVISPGLPAEPLLPERRQELEALGNIASYWYTKRWDILAEAELDAGRGLSSSVVATLRRSAAGADRFRPLAALAARLTEPVLNVGERWADLATSDVAELAGPWPRLLAHAAGVTSARPSARWEKAGRALLAEAGPEKVRDTVLPWLDLVGRPRTLLLECGPFGEDLGNSYDPHNASALRGLVLLLSLLPPQPEIVRRLGALTETSLRKATGTGPRSPKVANACVAALSRFDDEATLGELSRLATRVTYRGTGKILEKSLEARARALGLSRDEVDELAVPGYGLTEVGNARHQLGPCAVDLVVTDNKAALNWQSAAGKAVKSVPAVVRSEHAEELKELKASVKDIDKMLTAQTERLDRQFVARRSWPYRQWRERYLDHPLVGTLARRLLWTVDGVGCGFADGALRTLAGTPVTEGGTVQPWHPVGLEVAEVMAWRDWLERHGITQPFKQAHREVYLLTDAERRTGTYSNRFAGHILRQHQFHSLAAVRGWRDQLRLGVDDEVPPAMRVLPQWGLRAEYWIGGDGEQAVTESGSYLRILTDQVRFYPADAPLNLAHCYGGSYTMARGQQRVDPLPLTGIPPIVLSEVFRDVDLFVGVASIGNDPTWEDGGPGGRYREYWAAYSFGELSQNAETRRDLLTRLLPRLAISDRCAIEGCFLRVRGSLHTYKIHLGSGNILMTPGDRYLCIVPSSARGSAVDTRLPFDGDPALSVILSKATLLAHDTGITDPAILCQL